MPVRQDGAGVAGEAIDGSAASAVAVVAKNATGGVAGTVASSGAGDSSGSSSGACHSRPSSSWAPTSHHSMQRIAADRRGHRRPARQMAPISTAAWMDAQTSRVSRMSEKWSSASISRLLAP